jgi:hypothetical protein
MYLALDAKKKSLARVIKTNPIISNVTVFPTFAKRKAKP